MTPPPVNIGDDEEGKGYSWEKAYERTWDVLLEDEEGVGKGEYADHAVRSKRRRQQSNAQQVQRGLMRHMVVCLDTSEAMSDNDIKPNRVDCSLKLLDSFLHSFFDQNPISQVAMTVTRDAKADRITHLGGNPSRHIEALKSHVQNKKLLGTASLQNSLELGHDILQAMPSHTSRELLLIYGSLTTSDPGDIDETIDKLVASNIRVSIIGLAAAMHICQVVTKKTNGSYDIILDENHFGELLKQHLTPPAFIGNREMHLVRMGFPSKSEKLLTAFCRCHRQLQSKGFECPQCYAKHCDMPVECMVCGLHLISSADLSRSYHHIFPLPVFRDIKLNSRNPIHCYSCRVQMKRKTYSQCPKCEEIFCFDCDMFIHDVLHSCPGCAS
eukprot:Clim_evm7s42 gene=Clim_evmTU7s42